MRKTLQFAALAALLLSISTSCAQVPTTQPMAAYLKWTAPVPVTGSNWKGCVSDCSYGIYRESVATATTPCDAGTSANYKSIATTAVGVLTYEDISSSVGGFYCYVVATLQAGNVSPASNSVLANVPPLPLAPGTVTTTTQTAANDIPALPLPQLAKPAYALAFNQRPLQLTVTVHR